MFIPRDLYKANVKPKTWMKISYQDVVNNMILKHDILDETIQHCWVTLKWVHLGKSGC